MAKRKQKGDQLVPVGRADYDGLLVGLSALLDQSRRSAARAVNAVLTATYWEVGRRIVEFEQGGRERAGYGEALMAKLAADLSGRYGRGFSRRNLEQMRVFYLDWEMQPAGTGALQARTKGGAGGESADAVCGIDGRRAGPRDRRPVPAPLVPLRPTHDRAEPRGPPVLRGGGDQGRVVGPPARPADRDAVLRAAPGV